MNLKSVMILSGFLCVLMEAAIFGLALFWAASERVFTDDLKSVMVGTGVICFVGMVLFFGSAAQMEHAREKPEEADAQGEPAQEASVG